eukprot:126045-Rhodomonas_salina.9
MNGCEAKGVHRGLTLVKSNGHQQVVRVWRTRQQAAKVRQRQARGGCLLVKTQHRLRGLGQDGAVPVMMSHFPR